MTDLPSSSSTQWAVHIKSLGLIDMNQELYDPMEETFATDWQVSSAKGKDLSSRYLGH